MQSTDSEKLLLSVSMDPARGALLGNLLDLVSDSDFHLEFHGVLWNCIRVMHDTGAAHDPTAVLDYTKRKGLFVGGVEYIGSLVEDPLAIAASDEAVLAAAERIKRYASLRGLQALLISASQQCAAAGPEGLEYLLGVVEDGVQSLRKTLLTSRTGPQSMGEIMDSVMGMMEQQMDGNIVPAASTGYDDVDAVITGLRDEDLIVIGGRPSMGKSSLALNIGENVANIEGEQILMFSLEMNNKSLGHRALARHSRVDLSKIMRCEIPDQDWSRIVEGIETLRNSRVWIDDTPGLTIADIRARARTHFQKHGKCRILVDYLQFVSSSSGKDTKDHVSEVSRGLKNMARELKTTVIALSQLSRSLESRTNKRPVMSDLRESGAIEQDADIIMFVYRDEYYNPDSKEPGTAEVITAKNRNGPTGTALLGFHGATTSFFNLSRL